MEPRLPLPESLSCRLSIKNGEPFEGCRDKCPPSPAFVYEVADGYRVLRAKVEEHFLSKLPGQWRPDFDIYVKPSNNAKQKQFEVLCEERTALQAQLQKIWDRARLRHNKQAGFEVELFVSVPKPEAQTTLRRASASRIQEQMPRVAAFLREQQVDAGPASQRYMAVAQARLPDGVPMTVPDNTTFQQLQHIDTQQLAMDSAMAEAQEQADQEYRVVRIKLHGIPVPVQVNISDLCEALGLPNYSLRPPFRPPTNIETPAPTTNMEDDDHIDEQSQAMEQ
ncbi:hypothetical protein PR001_g8917 [Phytophthora rubi]|uniref:Uncharacterized protein n=1 Tax=Phytophthora rubi TaxID=129364 RepID=A0A6A3N4N7_9STRA|nr:hypothetical protein PR001_g8917 [Phytophthora rubi]